MRNVGAGPDMNRYLKLFGVTIVAVVLIPSAAYAIVSFLTSESNISISLRIKDIEGNIVEKGVVYAWALLLLSAIVSFC